MYAQCGHAQVSLPSRLGSNAKLLTMKASWRGGGEEQGNHKRKTGFYDCLD
jgi:hypothetical protein